MRGKDASRCFHWERKKEAQLTIFLISVSKKPYKKSTLKGERRNREMDGVCDGGEVGVGGRGLQPPHPKSCFFHSFLSEWSLIVYTYGYIDTAADRGMCISIYFHYIDSYCGRRDTDFLFVACPGRETTLVLVTNISAVPPLA